MARMTKLLDDAIKRLRNLPGDMQDAAARALLMQLEDEPGLDDLDDMAEGWTACRCGDFVTLDQLRRDMGLGDR